MGRYLSTKVSKSQPGISYTKDIYGTGNYRLFFSSGNWEVPIGVSSVRVALLGAGGGPGGLHISRSYPSCCYSCDAGVATSCWWRCGGCCYQLAHQHGGGGGGGGFTIGTAAVTPGCICCVVVGAGGAAGCDATGSCLPGGNGSAGGYSCAFGICATGGGGGIGGACVCCGTCGLCAVCWALTPACSTCATGGTGNGNLVIVCGNPGSTPCWPSTPHQNYLCRNNCFGVGYGGASGSPLGYDSTTATTCQWAIPDRMNSAAFDGRSVGWCDLQLDYGLENPRYPGQIVYTQYCDARTGCNIYHQPGVLNGYASGCVISSCSQLSCGGNATCCNINLKKQLWQGTKMEDQSFCQYGTCYSCCYVGLWYCTNNTTCICPGCGGGGVPSVWSITCNGHIAPTMTACQMYAKTGGSGMAIVEW